MYITEEVMNPELEGTITEVVDRLQSIEHHYISKGYTNIFLEVSYDYDPPQLTMFGQRKETNEERQLRLRLESDRAKQDEQRERKLLSELMKKYGNEGDII